jgi:hypothetical protein
MRAELSDEQGERLRRLSEEIRGRLLEIALITARDLGIRLNDNSVIKFVPKGSQSDRADAGAGDWMEIEDVDGFEVCYGSIGGHAFAESPCGGGVIEV